jgi:hypothetical protein
MSFFGRLFGKLFGGQGGEASGESGGAEGFPSREPGPGMSLYEMSRGNGIPLSRETCEVCSASFHWPEQYVNVTTTANPLYAISPEAQKALQAELDRWSVDVGGFCPRCRKRLCPRHVKLVENPLMPTLGMVPGCGKCGAALAPKR